MSEISPKQCESCKRTFASEQDFLKETTRWRLCSMRNLWFNCSCGSTLMLPKGKYPWYSPEKAMSPEAASLFNRLATLKDLPKIPTSIIELQQAVDNPQTDATTLARLLKKEPFLAAEILRIADNMRGMRNPVTKPITSLEHAVVYVGVKTLSDLVVAATIRQFKLGTQHFNSQLHWTEAFTTAAFAEFIGKYTNSGLVPDELYLAGCFANVGKIVSAICFAPIADDVSQRVFSPGAPTSWRAAEKTVGAIDHTLLGEIAASLWGLPKFALETIRQHHELPFVHETANVAIVDIVAFANQMTHWVLLRPARIEEKIVATLQEKLGIKARDLDTLADSLSAIYKLTQRENAA